MVYPITYVIIGICMIFGMIDDSDLSEITQRIVHRTAAQEGEFPFMVSIQDQHTHYCGGSIISSKWVLSAAHCLLHDNIWDISLVYGSVNLCRHKECKLLTAEVDQFIIHEDHNLTIDRHDIGVIKVKNELEMNDLVRRIPLNIHQTVFPEGTEGLVIGWGRDSDFSTNSPYLQYEKDEVFSDTICGDLEDDTINTSLQMCAGEPERGTGICNGDSGGPLVVNGYQVGIASFVIKSCGIGIPNYYTRVSAYIDWIYNKTGLEELKKQQQDFKLIINIKIGLNDTNT